MFQSCVFNPHILSSSSISVSPFPEPRKAKFTSELLEDNLSNTAKVAKPTVVQLQPTELDTLSCIRCMANL
jgi:hypothetical protein